MTVGTQLKQTLAALAGTQSTLQQYAAVHPDQQAREQFEKAHQEIRAIVQDLEQRIREVEFEEPQFKGY